MSRLSLIIIGFGAFGQLVAELLRPHANIWICDPSAEARERAHAHRIPLALEADFSSADMIILSMPTHALESCLNWISPLLLPGQIVVDVCSVKEKPALLMQAILPRGVEIIATHPMFGPQSAKNGISGLQMVICPVRGKRWRPLAHFLREGLGLRVIVTTPEEHDRQAAATQGLTHLLARALGIFEHRPLIRTRSFELLMEAVAMVSNDAPEVFDTIIHGNRHMLQVKATLMAALEGCGDPRLRDDAIEKAVNIPKIQFAPPDRTNG